jgi:hypothetical protein
MSSNSVDEPTTSLADETLTPILARFERQTAWLFRKSWSVWLSFAIILVVIVSPLVVFWCSSDTTATTLGKDWAATVNDVASAAAILLAVFAAIKWMNERRDRATDVLLALEKEFQGDAVAKGKKWVEDGGRIKVEGNGELARSDPLDAMLRFYVVLYGVYRSSQVPAASLSICFRYWLAHYFCTDRLDFRKYVDAYYPTLRAWLHRDCREGGAFFRPRDFFGNNLDDKLIDRIRKARR